jgi:hypothetical protein
MTDAQPLYLATGVPGLDAVLHGEPLTGFRGVLTGTPGYTGAAQPLR